MATAPIHNDGFAELRAARGGNLGLIGFVAVFSAAVNLLNLTGPLFMMQVYDRVLGSRSVPTLVALFGLVAFLFVMMGLIDLARSRVMARVAMRFQDRLEGRVFQASLQEGALTGQQMAAQGGLRDLEAVRQLIGSPVLMALFDLPWAPVFLAGLYIFHPLLGGVATLGGAILVITTLLNQRLTRRPLQTAIVAGQTADRAADLRWEEAATSSIE
ncbi:MAG TPA: type I secretion system permease/ATPase, partial [Paracoccus sp. (in: a-proteobacteria)]|nr:type I secretion system permease/ATPase [Paracoccus sp. (in: a-proteobacteria)]